METKLLTYPDNRLLQISGFVREFDENLFKLLDELKKISEANNLKGLAAIQIGVPQKVIVYKKDNNYIELINPTIYFQKGSILSKEKDETIPDVEFDIKRYETIKIMYYDRNNNQKFLESIDIGAKRKQLLLSIPKWSKNYKLAKKFLDLASSKKGKEIMKKYGFLDE